jgi:hypothetical protein
MNNSRENLESHRNNPKVKSNATPKTQGVPFKQRNMGVHLAWPVASFLVEMTA